jgi:hypothetical protein
MLINRDSVLLIPPTPFSPYPPFSVTPFQQQQGFSNPPFFVSRKEGRVRTMSFLIAFFLAGEHMTEGELSELMSTLLGISDLGGSAEVGVSQKENLVTLMKTHLPERISVDMFVGKVLGFATESGER